MYMLYRHIIKLSDFVKQSNMSPKDIEFIEVILTKDGISISRGLDVYIEPNSIFIPRETLKYKSIEIVNDISDINFYISRFTMIIKSNTYDKIHLTDIHATEMHIRDSYNYIRLNNCVLYGLYLNGYINRLTVTNSNITNCIGSYINKLNFRSNDAIKRLLLNKINKINFSKRLVTENDMHIYCSDIGNILGCKYTFINISDTIQPSRSVINAPFLIENIKNIDALVVAYIISLGV